GTVAQKLIWHQVRKPTSITQLREDVPEELLAILDKMMAKDKAERYQAPLEVAEALVPFTQESIPPPPEPEMPKLVPAFPGGLPGGGRACAGAGSPRRPGPVHAEPEGAAGVEFRGAARHARRDAEAGEGRPQRSEYAGVGPGTRPERRHRTHTAAGQERGESR